MRFAEEVFKVDSVAGGIIPVGDDQCRFDATVFERIVKQIVKEGSNGDEMAVLAEVSQNQNPKPCPTFVVSKSAIQVDGPPVLFRSYECQGFNPAMCTIWQAARATTAAPSFFRPIFIETPAPGGWFLDGGMGHNNPSELALDEAQRIWVNVQRFCLVSIGTGKQMNVELLDPRLDSSSSPGSSSPGRFRAVLSRIPGATGVLNAVNSPRGLIHLKGIAKACVDLCTDSEKIHRRVFARATSPTSNLRSYHRFNVERGLDTIGLEEWRLASRLGQFTSGYLAEGEGQAKRDACVKSLLYPGPAECM